MTVAAFNPNAYYRFFNAAYGSNYTLSLGLPGTTPSTPMLTQADAYSSGNWQIFSDAGVYFIRNYDWGAAYQLGITNENGSVVMLRSNGSLGMQWKLSPWDESSNSTWRLTNGLSAFGNQFFLGVSIAAASSGEDIVLDMSASKPGATWVLDINDGAGNITDSSMLTPFKSVQTASASIASTATETLATKSAQTSSHAGSSSSSSIAPGAIAGITIGVVAFIATLILFLFIFVRRRRRHDRDAAREHLVVPSGSSDSEQKSEKVGSAPFVSELYVPPSELSATSGDDDDMVIRRAKQMTLAEIPGDSSFSDVSNETRT